MFLDVSFIARFGTGAKLQSSSLDSSASSLEVPALLDHMFVAVTFHWNVTSLTHLRQVTVHTNALLRMHSADQDT